MEYNGISFDEFRMQKLREKRVELITKEIEEEIREEWSFKKRIIVNGREISPEYQNFVFARKKELKQLYPWLSDFDVTTRAISDWKSIPTRDYDVKRKREYDEDEYPRGAPSTPSLSVGNPVEFFRSFVYITVPLIQIATIEYDDQVTFTKTHEIWTKNYRSVGMATIEDISKCPVFSPTKIKEILEGEAENHADYHELFLTLLTHFPEDVSRNIKKMNDNLWKEYINILIAPDFVAYVNMMYSILRIENLSESDNVIRQTAIRVWESVSGMRGPVDFTPTLTDFYSSVHEPLNENIGEGMDFIDEVKGLVSSWMVDNEIDGNLTFIPYDKIQNFIGPNLFVFYSIERSLLTFIGIKDEDDTAKLIVATWQTYCRYPVNTIGITANTIRGLFDHSEITKELENLAYTMTIGGRFNVSAEDVLRKWLEERRISTDVKWYSKYGLSNFINSLTRH